MNRKTFLSLKIGDYVLYTSKSNWGKCIMKLIKIDKQQGMYTFKFLWFYKEEGSGYNVSNLYNMQYDRIDWFNRLKKLRDKKEIFLEQL